MALYHCQGMGLEGVEPQLDEGVSPCVGLRDGKGCFPPLLPLHLLSLLPGVALGS